MKNKWTTQNVVLGNDVVTRGNAYSTCDFMKIRQKMVYVAKMIIYQAF